MQNGAQWDQSLDTVAFDFFYQLSRHFSHLFTYFKNWFFLKTYKLKDFKCDFLGKMTWKNIKGRMHGQRTPNEGISVSSVVEI